MSADVSEMLSHARELRIKGVTTGARALPVMHRAGNNMVREAQELAPSAPVIRHYADTISYSVEMDALGITLEMGPEEGEQGSLGHLLELGVESRGIPPQSHLLPAFENEVPRLETFHAHLT